MPGSLKYPIPKPPAPTNVELRSPRGALLAARTWPSKVASAPRGLCLLVHGGGWHSGYFEELAAALARADVFVAGYDKPGDGYSEPEPDAPGEGVTHVRSFDWFVEDIFAAVEWMKEEAAVQAEGGRAMVDALPVFLFGESFGGLQVLGAALDKDEYNCRIDGVVVSGGLIHVKPEFLPPAPVVKVLVLISQYYPKVVMPATDFESTFDEAFGDKDWALTARVDPKIVMAIKPTIGAAAATLATGDQIMARAKELTVPMFAVHGKGDVRTECDSMQKFTDLVGPNLATMKVVKTDGHQLLQDTRAVTEDVIESIVAWVSPRCGVR